MRLDFIIMRARINLESSMGRSRVFEAYEVRRSKVMAKVHVYEDANGIIVLEFYPREVQ